MSIHVYIHDIVYIHVYYVIQYISGCMARCFDMVLDHVCVDVVLSHRMAVYFLHSVVERSTLG